MTRDEGVAWTSTPKLAACQDHPHPPQGGTYATRHRSADSETGYLSLMAARGRAVLGAVLVAAVALTIVLPAQGARSDKAMIGDVGVVCLIGDPPRDLQYRQAPHRCWIRVHCGEGWCTLQLERLRWDIWNRNIARGTGPELSDPNNRLRIKLSEPVTRCGRSVFSVVSLRRPPELEHTASARPYTCVGPSSGPAVPSPGGASPGRPTTGPPGIPVTPPGRGYLSDVESFARQATDVVR
jgi:hypothetical protein